MRDSSKAQSTKRKILSVPDPETSPEHESGRQLLHRRESSPSKPDCRVPGCINDSCRLHTHRTYLGTSSRPRTQRQGLVKQYSDNPYIGQAAFTQDYQMQHGSLPTLCLNGSPPLPFEAGEFEGSFKELFNEFFMHSFDRISLIYRPPRPKSNLRQMCLEIALRDPIYCLTIISQANLEILWEGGHQISEDNTALQLYSRLVSHCRRELEEPEQAKIDSLIFAIAAMFQYDLCIDRFEALHSHRKGLLALSSKRGGPHNLGLSLPYALQIDRAIAAFTSQLPALATSSLHIDIPKTIQDQISSCPSRIGDKWEDSGMEDILIQDVLSYCRNASVLMKIAKLSNITFVPEMLPARMSPHTDFFYYFRDIVDQEFVQLNARLSPKAQEHNTPQRDTLASAHCTLQFIVILAVKIVTYMVLQANYMPAICLHFSQYLRQALSSIDLQSDMFSSTSDMLLWILFADALPTAYERNMDTQSLQAHRQWAEHRIATVCRKVLVGGDENSDREDDDLEDEDEGDGIEDDAEYEIERYHTSDASSVESPIIMRHARQHRKQQEKEFIWSVLEEFMWAEELRPQFEEIWERVVDRMSVQ